MKKINKNEPDFYKEFAEQDKPRSWGDLSREIGYDVRKYMLEEEQHFQCAYTEVHIDPDPGNSHVDHFRKQSLFPKSVFKWNNLLTACNSEHYGAKFKDKNIRGKEDYQYLINPVKEEPQRYFSYSMTGEILADEDDRKGQFTIDSFNLNDRSLVERRKMIVCEVMAMCNQLSLDQLIHDIGSFESFIRVIHADLKNIEHG